MTWIDTTVITIVVIGALFIFYRALKEPIDLLFGWIKLGIGGLVGFVKDKGEGVANAGYEVITYG